MQEPHILLIESRTLFGFEFANELATAFGAKVSFMTCDVGAYLHGNASRDVVFAPLARVVEVPNTADPGRARDRVLELHASHPITGIVTFSDQHALCAATLANELGLRYASPDAVQKARNKDLTRRALDAAGVPQPKGIRAVNLEEARAAMDKIGFPVVVKPVDGASSVNVKVVRNASDLMAHARVLFERSSYGRSARARGEMLIEELLQGELVSVETVSVDARHRMLGITSRIIGGEPYFMELGGSFPAAHPRRERIEQVCSAALDAIGFAFGASHTELMVTADDVKVIEINGRLAGGPVPSMLSLAYGTSIDCALLGLHLTGRFVWPETPQAIVATRAFYSEVTGTVRSVTRSPLANEPRVRVYRVLAEQGSKVRAVRCNEDRLGFAICVGPTEHEAVELADAVFCGTRFEVDPD